MEKRCRVCKLKYEDPEFYEFLYSKKRSLREYQRMARKQWKKGEQEFENKWGRKGHFISYSSFRRHNKAGNKHE